MNLEHRTVLTGLSAECHTPVPPFTFLLPQPWHGSEKQSSCHAKRQPERLKIQGRTNTGKETQISTPSATIQSHLAAGLVFREKGHSKNPTESSNLL